MRKILLLTVLLLGLCVSPAAATETHAVSWGRNVYGQLGGGYETAYAPYGAIPSAILKTKKIVQIAESGESGYAVTSAGELYAWGGDHWGQLGDEMREGSLIAYRVEIPSVKQIAVLGSGAVALLTSGEAMTWGSEGTGEVEENEKPTPPGIRH
jgi:alpha-tubulin suppressor-like RCC1 family protein